MSELDVQIPTAFDPFAEANAEDSGAGTKEYVHIRVQQRNGRKSLTTVQGLKKDFSYNKILKDLKKEFCCNGTVVQDPELGQVIQLQGDQRKNVSSFLVQAGIVKKDNIKIHVGRMETSCVCLDFACNLDSNKDVIQVSPARSRVFVFENSSLDTDLIWGRAGLARRVASELSAENVIESGAPTHEKIRNSVTVKYTASSVPLVAETDNYSPASSSSFLRSHVTESRGEVGSNGVIFTFYRIVAAFVHKDMDKNNKGQKRLKRIKAPAHFEKEQSYSQYKCNMTAFQDLVFKIYGKLKTKERRLLREVLKKTPFWNLIELYDKGLMKKATTKKSDKDVHRIVQCYDMSLKKFRFRKHLAEISVSDVHYILGLPMSGLTMPNPKDGSRKPTDNPIVQRFFAEEKRIERGKIMSCIDAELDNKESPERIDNAVVDKRRNIYAAKENSDDDFEDPQLKIQPKKRKMEVKKEKVGVVVRRNKIEKKAVIAKKSNKNKKKDAAEEVQEDATDQFMEIATEQVQEGATKQVQEEPKYLTLEDWVSTKEIENQHAKVDGKGKEMVEFNFENGEGAKGNVDELEDAIYEQNAAETERILKKYFSQDRDGETEVFSKKMKHQKMSTHEELEQWVKQMEKEALIYNGIGYQSSEDEDVNTVEHRQLWLLQKGLEGAGSEKDTEGEKGGARSEKIVALEAEKSVAKVATEEFFRSKCGSFLKCATAQEAEKGVAAKDDKVAETVTSKAIEKGKVENEAQPATSPRTRSIVKRIKGRRD
ncbi:hypothetical protein ACLB2K_029097 [Fragaria x ananassa]